MYKYELKLENGDVVVCVDLRILLFQRSWINNIRMERRNLFTVQMKIKTF